MPVPHESGSCCEPNHRGREIGHVGDGVQRVGVAEEIDLFAGLHLRHESFTETSSPSTCGPTSPTCGQLPSGSVRPDAPRRRSSVHPGPTAPFLVVADSASCFAQRTVDIAVSVQVLDDDQQRTRVRRRRHDTGLECRELLGPAVVGRLGALVDDVGSGERPASAAGSVMSARCAIGAGKLRPRAGDHGRLRAGGR